MYVGTCGVLGASCEAKEDATLGYSIDRKKREYGRSYFIELEGDHCIIGEAHMDQYSINWSTFLAPMDFLEAWLPVAADSTVMIAVDGRADPLVMRASDLQGLVDGRELASLVMTLVRFWFEDVTVAWQGLLGSGGRINPIVGLASDSFDFGGAAHYMRATATPEIRYLVDDALMGLSEEWHYPSNVLRSLGYAKFPERGYL
jgi:hypothetical protein